jgi:ribosome-associated protein
MIAENMIVINEEITIPLSEIQFRFDTSSGPGGQHVNKSSTRVTLLFDVATSASLTDQARQTLLAKLANRLDKDGNLQIQVQESRSQHRNRETAVRRLQALLWEALQPQKKRRPTKPSKGAKERRLTEKRKHSEKKQRRSSGNWQY